MTPLPLAAAAAGAAADEFRDPLFLKTHSMISLTFAGHAPALSPSTVLLRGILFVYKTKQLYCVLKK